MPRVKPEYVVSFSSEDPDHPASTLLAAEVSKKKWLCRRGEPSCSVVLQLTKAVQISSVHIGVHHAALVEVLVGRSENPNDAFEVLVPSSVLLSPTESRREATDRVRTWSYDQLRSPVREQKWDRVRVVCSQPYNKHCQYGLSFVHLFEPESLLPSQPAAAPPPAPPRFSLDAPSSDEEEFRPGELFAKLRKQSTSTDTGAQIRQATSKAIKNISDSSTKLVKAPIAKQTQRKDSCEGSSKRGRNDVLYTDDDDQPHAKIDRVVQRYKDEKSRDALSEEKQKEKDRTKIDKVKDDKPKYKDDKNKKGDRSRDKSETGRDNSSLRKDESLVSTPNNSKDRPSSSNRHDTGEKNDRKRRRSEEKVIKKERATLRPGPVCSAPHRLLAGVRFALSGYENPLRARLRDAACSLGARYERDWGPACTHLICAFPNTPKLRLVRAAPGGEQCVAVRGEWLERCGELRRLLPWEWFATEPRHQRDPDWALADEQPDCAPNEEGDTDDEIEKVLMKQKRRKTDDVEGEEDASTSRPPAAEGDASIGNVSRESDVTFVKDERVQGHVTVEESDSEATDEEGPAPAPDQIAWDRALPAFFEGLTFAMDPSLEDVGFQTELLARYIRAYGGEILSDSQLEESSPADYSLASRGRAGAGGALRPDWVWRCHRERALWPVHQYLLADTQTDSH